MKFPICPVCKSPKTRLKLKLQSHKLYHCQTCTFEFLPKPKKIKPIYTIGYFKGQLEGAQGYKDYNSLEVQLIKESAKKLEYIKNITSRNKLLDLGCGTGTFLQMAKSKGFKITGNDISHYAINHLKKNKIPSIKGSIESNILPKNSFDIITGWDVIEHLHNPAAAIKHIHTSLRPDGYLFLTTPDTDRFDARLMGKYWYGYKKIPEHVGFFNSFSMTKLLEDSNFKVINIKPWGFYRDLNFIMEKLQDYSPFFIWMNKLISFTGIQKLSFFIPLTDSIIVAQKK